MGLSEIQNEINIRGDGEMKAQEEDAARKVSGLTVSATNQLDLAKNLMDPVSTLITDKSGGHHLRGASSKRHDV